MASGVEDGKNKERREKYSEEKAAAGAAGKARERLDWRLG